MLIIKTIQIIKSKILNLVFTTQTFTGSSSEENPDANHASTSFQSHISKVQANFSSNGNTILLRTALVQVEHQGDLFTIRALIDPGSQRTFLSNKVRYRLQLQSLESNFEIIGIGGQKQTASRECDLVLFSRRHNIRFTINAVVLPKLTHRLPATSFEIPTPTFWS